MSRSRIPSVRIHKDSASAKPQKSDSANHGKSDFAKQLFDHLALAGLSESEAWQRAGELLRPAGGYAAESDIGRMSQVAHSEASRNQTMVQALKKASANGKGHAKATNLTRTQAVVNDGWVARIARGLRRWREREGLTIPKAAEQIGMNLTAMYRIEKATHPATTAVHLDGLCQAINMDVEELFRLGREP